jgi:hypothetical protein
MKRERMVMPKGIWQIVFFVGILLIGSLLVIATGGGGGGGGDGGDSGVGSGDNCSQLEGVWSVTVSSQYNTCPPPAYQGIWNENLNISLSDSTMTLRIGNSTYLGNPHFLFQGPLTCNGSSFSYNGVYTYTDIVDQTCIYTAVLTLNGNFTTEQQFTGTVKIDVSWAGGICDPGSSCETGGSVTADKQG